MVYAPGRGLRSFAEIAALIALTVNAIPAVHAEGSDEGTSSSTFAATTPTVGSLESCGISDGDKAFGIQVISDPTCAGGGFGCYNDHCRYCKILDTLKSAHLNSCASLGAHFPSMAPLAVSTGPCNVSSGDSAVGIAGMTDPTCLYGGLGCFNDHCRFCKTEMTPQSSQFLACPWLEGSASASGFADADAGDVNLVPVLVVNDAPGPALLTTLDSYASSSDAPGPALLTTLDSYASSSTGEGSIEAFEVTTADVCTLSTSDGDAAVGINITTDATCGNGGLGCINSLCRFCKAKNTTQSSYLNDCPVTTKMCTTTLSEGDAAIGLQIVTDAACAQGGLGCIDDVCRFCRASTTAQSASYIACTLINGTVSSSEAPATTTAAPGTSTPVVVTQTPTPIVTTMATKCNQTVSDGDTAVGIDIVTDSSCVSGGLGCIDEVCRFCRVTTTVQSATFVDCATIEGTTTATSTTTPASIMVAPVSTTSAPTTLAPTTPTRTTQVPTPAPTTPAPTTPVPTTPSPTTPVPTTPTPTTPSPTTPVPTTPTPTPTATTSNASNVCSILAAAGDVQVGINIVTDPSCAEGGLGCLDTVCRFCRTTTTTESATFVDCASLTGVASTTKPSTISTATSAPTPTPTLTTFTTPSISFECSRTVSSGDKGVGLDIVSDVRCSDGGAGCLDDVCRFCKQFETVQSESYIDCSSIPSSSIGADITFVPIPIVDDSETPTTRMLSAEEATDTSKSGYGLTNTDAGFESAEEATKVCATTVSEGDASVGINIITDTSCASGGLGCMNVMCRLCKVKTTMQSGHLGNCSDYSSTPAVATVIPATTTVALTTVAPTTAATSTAAATYAIQLQCYQTVSDGDKKQGMDMVTDIRCGDGGVGCVDSICRFCKVFETTRSYSFLNCSDIPSADYGSDINFVAIVPVDGTQSQESGDEDVTVSTHESTETTLDPPACADMKLADGQAEGGIGVVLDTVNCPEGLSSGCIGDFGCRYCKRFPTNISEYLDYCAVVNSSDVDYAISDVVSENTLSDEVDALSVNDNASSIQKIVENGNFQLVAAVAACVGVVAFVVLGAFGVKHTMKTRTRTSIVSPRRNMEDRDSESSPIALVASTIGEPGVTSEV